MTSEDMYFFPMRAENVLHETHRRVHIVEKVQLFPIQQALDQVLNIGVAAREHADKGAIISHRGRNRSCNKFSRNDAEAFENTKVAENKTC